VLRVVRGEPTPAELAALIAVVAARSAGGGPAEPPSVSAWSDRRASLRPVLAPGRDAWRWSSFAAGHRTRADW
jgi:hypothetical protein